MEGLIIITLATIAGGVLILLMERNIHEMPQKSKDEWMLRNQQYLIPKNPLADREWPSYHMNMNYPVMKTPNYGYTPEAYRDYYRIKLALIALIFAAASILAVVLALKYNTLV